MANEVKTIFTGDPTQLYKIADDVEKRLKSVFTQPAAIAPKGDALLQYATRDIKQIESARIKSQKLIEGEILKSEKALTAVAVREVKIRNDAEIKALRQRQSQSGGGAGREFATQIGSNLPGVGSIFSGAASGGIAGAAAAGVLLAASAVKSLTTEVVHLGVESVKVAANFQGTVNAMTVFTGSSKLAERELESIAELAKNTPGLRLNDAREGATRLRALGFEAGLTKDLLVGISKQKVINNADEGAVQRVILNLTQLKAGSPQVGRDIKEMILAFPALSLVIKDTFGSLDKFKSAIQDNPDAAIKKFAAALKNVQAPAGGLNGALGKLSDAFQKAGEAFGKPILKPLTDAVNNIALTLEKNKSVWANWGEYVGDIIRGVNRPNPQPPTPQPNSVGLSGVLFGAYGQQLLGSAASNPYLTGLLGYTLQNAEAGRGLRLAEERKSNIANAVKNTLPFGGSLFDPKEQQVIQDQKEREQKDATERNKQAEIAQLESKFKERFSIINNGLQLEEARASASFGLTLNQEKQQLQQISNLRRQNIQEQIQANTEYFDKQIELADGDKNEIFKITNDKNQKLRELNLELQKNYYDTAKAAYELQEKTKAALNEIRGLISGNFANSSGNQFVTIFENARNSIEKAREATKGFSQEIRNAAIQSAQAANGGSLFGARIGTRLEADSLQQSALKFLGGGRLQTNYQNDYDAATGKLVRSIPYQSLIGGGNFSNNFSAEQKKVQADLARQIQLVKSTPFSDIKELSADDRARYVNNSIADLVKNLNPEDLNADLRGQAAQALLRQAGDKLKEESQALKFYDSMNKIITEKGLQIVGADSNVTVNAYNGATYDVNGTPTRPAQNQTRSTR